MQADQLFDYITGEFRCTYCREIVEEDQSALPKKDSRLMLAKFNEQLEPLYVLLREVEGIRLAPEVLEPEPVDISALRGVPAASRPRALDGLAWSGEATRGQGFTVEEARVDVTIGEDSTTSDAPARKERPIWMMESTVGPTAEPPGPGDTPQTDALLDAAAASTQTNVKSDDIMSVLLAHEKKANSSNAALRALPSANDSDSNSDDLNVHDNHEDIGKHNKLIIVD